MNVRSVRSNEAKSVPLTRDALAGLKQKAWRRGLWFRVLKPNERRLLDLTIKVVQRVRSFRLAKVVSSIVSRLCEAMESRVCRLIRVEGKMMVKQLSDIAVSWGYMAAKNWAEDRGFMQYVTINNLWSLGS